MMTSWGMGWGGGFGPAGGVFMLLFWGLLIAAVVIGVRWVLRQTGSSDRRTSGDTALEILRERYARGEIDSEEFQRRKRDLDRLT